MPASRTSLYRIQHLPQHPMAGDHQAYHPPPAVETSERLLVQAQMTTEAFQSPSVCHSRPFPVTTIFIPFWPVHQRQIISPRVTGAPVSSALLPTHPKPPRLYTTIPLPPQVDPDVSIIPFLQSGSGSGLDIDLRMSSRQLGLRGEPGTARTQLQRYLGSAATNPQLPSMTVAHPKLPWLITIYRSGMEYVTVWDVLVTIVESLRLPIPMIPGADSNGMRGRGRAGTRLDYLPGRRLVGLRKSELGEEVWYMVVV